MGRCRLVFKSVFWATFFGRLLLCQIRLQATLRQIVGRHVLDDVDALRVVFPPWANSVEWGFNFCSELVDQVLMKA